MNVNLSRYLTLTVFAALLIGGGYFWATKDGATRQGGERHGSSATAGAPANTPEHEVPLAGHTSAVSPVTSGTLAPAQAVPGQRPAVHVFGMNGPVQLEDVPEGRFKHELRGLIEEARRKALDQLGKLHVPLNDVASLSVENSGQLFYHCAAPQLPPAPAEMLAEPGEAQAGLPGLPEKIEAAASVGIAEPPIRHSRPGATKVIYLDFNGHRITGTAWNKEKGVVGETGYRPAVTTYVAKPFDTDSDPATFSDAEQAVIIQVWERVAEDYRGFDVDVTTEEPAVFTANIGRVLITDNVDANGVNMPASTSAGVAFLNVFGDYNYASYYSPALVYANQNYNYAAYIAEGASHEMGHNLSLSHDGTNAGDEYYDGHGSGENSWGPIMGSTYAKNVTQWSKGEYYNANNTTQDDLAVIAGHLGYVPDDHTDVSATATPLNVSGLSVSGTGIISETGEADRFSFESGPGAISFTVSPNRSAVQTRGVNLDVALELYEGSGALVASANVNGVTTATLNTTVNGGTYYLRVFGAGSGTPLIIPPTGYTNYGSLGQYTIAGTVISTTPVAPAIISQPANRTVSITQAVQFMVAANAYPAPSFTWQRLPSGSSTWTNLSETGAYTGTATATLSIDSATIGMSGDQFRCGLTNTVSSVTTNAATLTVLVPVAPSITGQPVSQSIVTGNSVTFSVVSTGVPSPTFQWRKNGVNISGATSSSYTLTNVSAGSVGSYTVVVTNSAGSLTSNAAVLSLIVAPGGAIISITVQ